MRYKYYDLLFLFLAFNTENIQTFIHLDFIWLIMYRHAKRYSMGYEHYKINHQQKDQTNQGHKKGPIFSKDIIS